jgi:hypothetical protein
MTSTELVVAETSLREAKLRAERKELRKKKRATKLDNFLIDVKMHAAKVVDLKRHAFKTEAELDEAKLRPHEKALVRQWEQPKRLAAFAVEASARLIDSEVRARGETKKIGINVENAVIQLPPKAAPAMEPIVIEVDSEDQKKR